MSAVYECGVAAIKNTEEAGDEGVMGWLALILIGLALTAYSGYRLWTRSIRYRYHPLDAWERAQPGRYARRRP